jgi:hypothetical protein
VHVKKKASSIIPAQPESEPQVSVTQLLANRVQKPVMISMITVMEKLMKASLFTYPVAYEHVKLLVLSNVSQESGQAIVVSHEQ